MIKADDGMTIVFGGPRSSIYDTHNFKGFWPNNFKRMIKIERIFGNDVRER